MATFKYADISKKTLPCYLQNMTIYQKMLYHLGTKSVVFKFRSLHDKFITEKPLIA